MGGGQCSTKSPTGATRPNHCHFEVLLLWLCLSRSKAIVTHGCKFGREWKVCENLRKEPKRTFACPFVWGVWLLFLYSAPFQCHRLYSTFGLAVYRCIRRTACRFRMCDWEVERMQIDIGIAHFWFEFTFDLNQNWWLVNEFYNVWCLNKWL